MSETLAAARSAYAERDWPRAFELFTAAGTTDLDAADLDAFAEAAWWLGRMAEYVDARESAYRAHVRDGDTRAAAMAAMDLAFAASMRGDEALGAAWVATARQLLHGDEDCVEHAYLRYFLEAESALYSDDLDAVIAAAKDIRALAERHRDDALTAATRVCEGRAMIRRGQVAAGLAVLDEAMAGVVAGDLRPDIAGNIYCNVVATCHELQDVARMRVWNDAFRRWCAAQSAAALFTGICRVHVAQLLQTHGEWARSADEAAQVCADTEDLSVAAAAEAHYVVGDARRLGGDLAGAEESYLRAHELGRDPQPGIALLRLVEGRHDVALRSIQAALTAEAGGPLARARLCAAAVEISTAAGALDVAAKAADELADTARTYPSAGLRNSADHTRAAVLLEEGHPEEALPLLRRACRSWRELDAAYECARVRRSLARAYAAVGDLDASERERAAADAELRHLGGGGRQAAPGGLTAREAEVLALVAQGRSNREVAAALVLSEKTVARHLSNIFTKLGLTSRTAAAAYAHRHGITGPDG